MKTTGTIQTEHVNKINMSDVNYERSHRPRCIPLLIGHTLRTADIKNAVFATGKISLRVIKEINNNNF